MTSISLRKLTIEHLRGSVRPFSLPFEKGKKLTVVYGENGTGKTTICDALEFLGSGKVGSLENRGLGKTNRYWPSVGKNAADVTVTLEADNGMCSARIQKADVVVLPPGSRPTVEVLRRSQILSLVQAKPGERYEAIRRFIDVSTVEASEDALRELIRSLKRNRDEAVARVQENQDAIGRFWETAGKPGRDPLAWAEQEAVRDTTGIQAELQALSELRRAHQHLAEFPGHLSALEQDLAATRQRGAGAAQAMEACLDQIADDAGELVSVLEAAQAFLEQHPQPPQCPLCESGDRVAGLSGRVEQRLEQLSALRSAKREKAEAHQALGQTEHRLQSLQKDAARRTQEFETVRTAHPWGQDVPLPATACPAGLPDLAAWLTTTCELPTAWSAAEAARHDRRQFLATLKSTLDTYQEKVREQKDLDRLLPRLERVLEIAEQERRTFTDGVLANIAQEVGRLYEAVHPREGLNKINLELDPKKRASLEIGATFCGQPSMPPQAYFSDSHLDTLGLCVFLALAALDAPDSTVLVLDDVLGSVDEPHVERLIEMLYAEALRFRHCIITTHYRPWKQKLRWGWLQHGQCQFVELTKWTSSQGLALTRSLPDVERLRQLLAETPPDPQLVCAKAGVVLEAALDFLTQLYECSIPRRANGLYTLGDLLPAVDRRLRQALKVDAITGHDAAGKAVYTTTSLAPMLDELSRIAQARNVFGCHFNTLSFDLLDRDAIGFGGQVLSLIDVLADPHAGWPRNGKSGSYWATAGETRRLYPLQKPA